MSVNYNHLERLLASGSDNERVAALKTMRSQISNGQPPWCFDLARRHVGDRNTDVGWQSIIVIGEYISSGLRNEEIWSLIMECCEGDDDMQEALSTVLLEHLLEYDFDRTIDKIRVSLPRKTTPLLNLLERCWRFGQPESKWRQLQDIIHSARRAKTRGHHKRGHH